MRRVLPLDENGKTTDNTRDMESRLVKKKILIIMIMAFLLVSAVLIHISFVAFGKKIPHSPEITKSEHKYERTIKIAFDQTYEPYSFFDVDGTFTGRDVELSYAVAKEMGVNVELYPMEWTSALTGTQKGDYDLLSGKHFDGGLNLLYSDFVSSESYVLIGRDVFESGLFALNNKKLCVVVDEIAWDGVIVPYGLERNTVRLRNLTECLEAVQSGKCDYAVCLYQPAIRKINREGLNLKVSKDNVLTTPVCYATAPGNEELIKELNSALLILREDGRFSAINDRWLSRFEGLVNASILFAAVLAFIAVAVLAIFYVLQLFRFANRSQENLVLMNQITGSAMWFIEFNKKGKIKKVNWGNGFRKVLGYTSEEDFPNIFSEWEDRLHPSEKKNVLSYFDVKTKDVIHCDYHMRNAKDIYIDVRTEARVVRYSNGKPRLVIGTIQDITDDLVKEELISVLSSVANSYISLHLMDLENDTFRDFSENERIEALVGTAGGNTSVAFPSVMRIMTADIQSGIFDFIRLDSLQERLAGKDRISIEFYGNYNGWCRGTFIPVEYNSENKLTKVVWCVQGIGEEKKKELEAKDALRKAYLEVSFANSAKNRFLKSMSHDMRTPLNGIMGMADIAKEHLGDKDKLSDCLQKISESSGYLLSLVNDILSVNELDSLIVNPKPVSCDVKQILDACLSAASMESNTFGVDVLVHTDDLVHPYVKSSPVHIRQILSALLSNAIKFSTNSAGVVNVTVDEVSAQQGDGAQQNAQSTVLRFTVKDNGIGMTQEFISHIFEPFSQAAEDSVRTHFHGSGLGMTIVKKYVDALNGDVSIKSELGKGTCVTVTIPVEVDENAMPAEKKAKEAVDVTGMKILLVDDNELNLEIAHELLSHAGLKVEDATDGRNAVDLFSISKEGEFQCIIMDIMMPIMDGYAAAKAIRSMDRADAKTVPIIALSANAFASDIQKSLDSGMNAHLAKPFDLKKTLETIQENLGHL